MRLIGWIMAICLALAALKAAAFVIALLIVLGLGAAAFVRPTETIGFIAVCILLSLAGTHPWAAAAILVALAVLKLRDDGPEYP